jgi:hypothetical protein
MVMGNGRFSERADPPRAMRFHDARRAWHQLDHLHNEQGETDIDHEDAVLREMSVI